MLKSCSYCGKIHDKKYKCSNKPNGNKQQTDIVRFRNSKEWKNKRKEICERDLYLCQVCKAKLFDIDKEQFNYENIEVHHIQPLATNWDKRVDDDNLISLCRTHHEMAEKGLISAKTLIDIVKALPPYCSID